MIWTFLSKPLVREILITVVLALAIFFAARATIQTYEVYQASMEPNLLEGQRVVVVKAVYWWGDPQRGDVVIFSAPDGSDEEYIKRVIGIPGDTVEVVNGVVYVNGFPLDEPYIERSFSYSSPKVAVPVDHYYVLGDNRNISNDSHQGWFLPRDNVIGKAWLVTWPPGDWGFVPDYNLDKQLAAAETD